MQIDFKYIDVLENILTYGYDYEDPNRKGVFRKELEQVNIKHLVQEGYPIITARKTYFKGAVGELLLFLKGKNDIRDYHKYGIKFWDKDTKNYEGKLSKYPISEYKKWTNQNKKLKKSNSNDEPFKFETCDLIDASINTSGVKEVVFEFENVDTGEIVFSDNPTKFIKEKGLKKSAEHYIYDLFSCKSKICQKWKCNSFSPKKYDMGKIYPYQYQKQIEVFDRFKENPLRTDLIVSSWQVEDLENMCLKPCHDRFQILGATDGFVINWSQRSTDFLLGSPINIQFYYLMGLLLEKWSGHKFNGIIGNLNKCHLYDNQYKIADNMIQLSTDLYKDGIEVELEIEESLKELPFKEFIKHIEPYHFKIKNYDFVLNEKAPMLTYKK